MAQNKSDAARDWKQAGEACLTTALARLEEVARDSSDAKTLESIAKTAGDIVGAGMYLSRGSRGASTSSGGGEDE